VTVEVLAMIWVDDVDTTSPEPMSPDNQRSVAPELDFPMPRWVSVGVPPVEIGNTMLDTGLATFEVTDQPPAERATA
jgi:hypothetical protein